MVFHHHPRSWPDGVLLPLDGFPGPVQPGVNWYAEPYCVSKIWIVDNDAGSGLVIVSVVASFAHGTS
jgi:hypothetical protein